MFNQIDVFLNQKLVSPPNNTYPYRAYIESMLNYSPIAKESHLRRDCGSMIQPVSSKPNRRFVVS